jgi:oxygen-dependent protoporphyrinogen oxidase
LKSPVLSWRGKLRLLVEPLVRRRIRQRAEEGGDPGDDESIADFARRRLGHEVFQQLVQPLVAGIYTADPERLSMAATMPQFLEYERTTGSVLRETLFPKPSNGVSGNETEAEPGRAADSASGARYGLFVAPREGMSGLIATLADCLPRLRVHFNSRVFDVRFDNQRWQINCDSQSPIENSVFDAIVVSLPAPTAAGVLRQCDAALAEELATIEYSGCAVVSLGFARQQIGHALDGFGFVVPEHERRRIIAGSFASLKFPGRAPEHHVLIRVFIGGALQPEMLKLSNNELVRIAQEELNQLLQIAGAPVVTDVARWPSSMPQYHVGHLGRIDRIEQFAARHATLALAGNAYRGVGVPQCVASGIAAAERIARVFSQRQVS